MKQSPSAGVHTFCDRQKPLPDGAAQYYVAGKDPALGDTGGTSLPEGTVLPTMHKLPAQRISSMGCSMELQLISLAW